MVRERKNFNFQEKIKSNSKQDQRKCENLYFAATKNPKMTDEIIQFQRKNSQNFGFMVLFFAYQTYLQV